MAELSLLEAFRECGPSIGDQKVKGLRSRAAEVLYRHVRALSQTSGFGPDIREDAASGVMCRLIENGPRGVREQDPPSDESVEWFLRRCIRNEALTHLRKHNSTREASLGDMHELPAAHSLPDLDKDAASRHLAQARQRLFGVVVPEVSAELPKTSRGEFIDAIEQRRAIAEGRKSCEECVKAAFGAVSKQARNRFDQQQSRALRRLGDGIETHIARHGLSAAEGHALRVVLDALKNREAFWPVGPEEASS